MRTAFVQPILKQVELPPVFEPGIVPDYKREEYLQRIDRLRSRLLARELDFGVIYADREHSGNLEYFTGIFSPFEETVLVILSEAEEVYILSGNEIIDGMIHLSPILDQLQPIRIQSFSLQGFFRDQSYKNKELLSDSFRSIGIKQGAKVGLIGWKYLEGDDATWGIHTAY